MERNYDMISNQLSDSDLFSPYLELKENVNNNNYENLNINDSPSFKDHPPEFSISHSDFQTPVIQDFNAEEDLSIFPDQAVNNHNWANAIYKPKTGEELRKIREKTNAIKLQNASLSLEDEKHIFKKGNFLISKVETHYKTTNNQSYFFGSSNSKLPSYARWMEDLQGIVFDIPLRDLIIVGSHDAGSYNINDKSPLGADFKKSGFIKNLGEKLEISPWCRTQERSIFQQLVLGIRYFDLRLAFSKDTFFIHHGLLGEKWKLILIQIENFIKICPKEVFILDLSHFMGFDLEVHERFVKETMDVLEDYCIEENDPTQLTLETMWKLKKNIIIIYENTYSSKHPLLWHTQYLHSHWHDCQEEQILKQKLDDTILEKSQLKCLVVQQCVITPNVSMIAKGLSPLAYFMKKGVQKIAYSLNPKVRNWLKSWILFRLNIVMVDYADSEMVQTCIELLLSLNARRLMDYRLTISVSPSALVYQVSFKSTFGRYLCAQRDLTLICDRKKNRSFEKWSILNHGEEVSIVSNHQTYLGINENKPSKLIINSHQDFNSDFYRWIIIFKNEKYGSFWILQNKKTTQYLSVRSEKGELFLLNVLSERDRNPLFQVDYH